MEQERGISVALHGGDRLPLPRSFFSRDEWLENGLEGPVTHLSGRREHSAESLLTAVNT